MPRAGDGHALRLARADLESGPAGARTRRGSSRADGAHLRRLAAREQPSCTTACAGRRPARSARCSRMTCAVWLMLARSTTTARARVRSGRHLGERAHREGAEALDGGRRRGESGAPGRQRAEVRQVLDDVHPRASSSEWAGRSPPDSVSSMFSESIPTSTAPASISHCAPSPVRNGAPLAYSGRPNQRSQPVCSSTAAPRTSRSASVSGGCRDARASTRLRGGTPRRAAPRATRATAQRGRGPRHSGGTASRGRAGVADHGRMSIANSVPGRTWPGSPRERWRDRRGGSRVGDEPGAIGWLRSTIAGARRSGSPPTAAAVRLLDDAQTPDRDRRRARARGAAPSSRSRPSTAAEAVEPEPGARAPRSNGCRSRSGRDTRA